MADDKIQRAIDAAYQAMLREDRYADGGEAPEDKGFFSKIFSGKQYQSTGEELVDPQTGAIRWGSGENPADYVRASDETVRRQRAEEAARKQADAQRIEVAPLAPPKPTSIADFSRLDFQYPEGQRPADLDEPAPAPVAAARASDMSPYAMLPLISMAESANKPTAQNPYSSAGGLYQFITPTWVNVLRRMDPETYGRMPEAQIASLRKSPETVALQHKAAQYHLEKDILPTLNKAQIPVNPATVYLGWFQGPAGAVRAWNAPGDTPMTRLFPETISANANLRYQGKPYAEWTRNDLINWVTESMNKRMRATQRAAGGRTGYADEGAVVEEPVYDIMGNVAVPGTPPEGSQAGAYEAAMDKIGKAGAFVGSPIKRALEATAETYAHSSREAAQETEALRQQAMRNLAGESGVVGRALALPQMGLSAMSNVFEPMTAAAKTVGKGATYLTGNPQFGERVEFLAGFADPSHVGAFKAATPMAAMAAPPVKAAIQTAREVTAAPRELTPMGLYSYGSETAMGLPQAKGTPEQIAAMLQKQGVKPEEMFSVGFANEAATNAKRVQIEAEFTPKIAEAQRILDGLTPGTPEFKAAERQLKNLSSTMRGEMDRALVLSEDIAGRPSLTREEAAQFFRERMPQVEETVLGGKSTAEFTPEMEARLNELTEKRIKYGLDSLTEAEQAEKNRLFKIEKEVMSGVSETKFGQYTLPGGENYREVLLRLPHEEKRRVGVLSNGTILSEEELANPVVRRTAEKIGLTMEDRMMPTMVPFKSGHWNDPNVLAHLRMADRTGPNGEKILHIEEIQSDWAQKGRKEGFVTQYKPEDIKPMDPANITSERRRNEFWNFETPTGAIDVPRNDRWPTMEAARQHILDNVKPTGVPTAPYVTNTQAWTDLALKRALKEAAEGGYDRLVWTPGAVQAKRYDLSQHVGKIYYDPELAGGTLAAEGLRPGQTILDKPNIKPENIADYIGKEAAEKLLAQPRDPNGMHMLEGNGLSMGGEGMIGYYDKIVPAQLQKLLKKLDPEARVGMTDVLLPPRKSVGHNNPPFEAPGITITPAMRENILKGMPHMADGGSVNSYPLRNHTDWEEAHDYEKSGGKLTHMSPDQFLSKVDPLKMTAEDKKKIQHFKNEMRSGTSLDPLAIEKGGQPNGRHRAHAAEKLGIKKVPVVTWPKKEKGGSVVDRALMLTSKKAKR